MEFGVMAVSPLSSKGNSTESKARSEKITKNQKNVAGMMIDKSCGCTERMTISRKNSNKVMTFRDTINFPPYDEAGLLSEVRRFQTNGDVMDVDMDEKNGKKWREESKVGKILGESFTDKKKVTCSYPNNPTSAPAELCVSVTYFLPVLLPLSPGNTANAEMLKDSKYMNAKAPNCNSNMTTRAKEQAVPPTLSPSPRSNPPETVSVTAASSKFNSNMMPRTKDRVKRPCNSPSNVTQAPPPPPILPSMAPPPPPAPMPTTKGAAPPPPPPFGATKGAAPPPPPPFGATKGDAPPPPPPFGAAKALRARKANNKLRRSTHMSNMYRTLKGKLEGSGSHGKRSKSGKSAVGGSSGGKQGMADALAEMTKRSSYFQQIEEDVQKHRKVIMEMKAAISSFQTKDMDELIKFQKYVEQNLEALSDETQVLARFEDFPTKKLETLRMASALYLKLKGMATDLQNWKVAPPLGELLDKVDCYFNKIKREVDALERTKDEESKRFQSHKVHFDFNVLVQIKESMVDVSSSCMELALQERRQAKAVANAETWSKTDSATKACAKMLWKAFQLAFRVYTFAGGQDDRADRLTKELAQEIENDPEHK